MRMPNREEKMNKPINIILKIVVIT
jgi:hypothetical protein